MYYVGAKPESLTLKHKPPVLNKKLPREAWWSYIMTELESLREQLKHTQKLASLGMLSAGIAHEIQNPLNFVINFSKMSEKLISDIKDIVEDIKDDISEDDAADLLDITEDLNLNMQKIHEHGERAISIIQGILLISRGKEGEKLPTDINHLVHEYAWLSYHAQRANDKSFNVSIQEKYHDGMPKVMVIPQDLSRAVLNVVNNACYAVKERSDKEAANGNTAYEPTISLETELTDNMLKITISDNGSGIPQEVQDKLFREIITTKPIGKGTGLGMQITHSIIVDGHGGEIKMESTEGNGTKFEFLIPAEIIR